MAYTEIDNPELYFQTKLYAGTGSTLSVTYDGEEDMSANMIWLKSRSGTTNHHIFDTVRGVNKYLQANVTNAEGTASTMTTFGSNGFTVSSDSSVNASSSTNVAWNWKCGTSVSGTTTGGTGKAYSGTVNTDAGISLITYLGNDNSAHVIPHHLGVAPELTIIKERSNVDIWVVQSSHLGIGNYMTLHTTSASATNGGNFITAVSSSTVTMNENAVNNANDQAYMLYSFASKQGYSKVGTYVGNANADGTFIYLGFKPAFVMVKEASAAGENWIIVDNKRTPGNPMEDTLYPNLANAEDTGGHDYFDFLSNGMKPYTTNRGSNGANTYIYAAFAEQPFVTSTGVPATAR